MKPSIIVDTLGAFCPVPIMRTSEAIRELEAGSLVEVLSDDPAIEHDLPAWCRSQGHSIESMVREGDIWRCLVRKRG